MATLTGYTALLWRSIGLHQQNLTRFFPSWSQKLDKKKKNLYIKKKKNNIKEIFLTVKVVQVQVDNLGQARHLVPYTRSMAVRIFFFCVFDLILLFNLIFLDSSFSREVPFRSTEAAHHVMKPTC